MLPQFSVCLLKQVSVCSSGIFGYLQIHIILSSGSLKYALHRDCELAVLCQLPDIIDESEMIASYQCDTVIQPFGLL